MSLWIRSQNKEILINVNCHLCVDYAEYDIDDETKLKSAKYGIWGDNAILGIYSTKEKALKVLDDIENYVARGYDFYRMPDDEDVEE